MISRSGIYIDGAWRQPLDADEFDAINPATEQACGRFLGGGAADVDEAVKAAVAAAGAVVALPVAERIKILGQIADGIEARAEEIAQSITAEMGSPLWIARGPHIVNAVGHYRNYSEILSNYRFAEQRGGTMVVREPIGVCGLITPWNWPLHLISIKVAAAIAAGCPMVLKPSEIAPTAAIILTEVIAASDLPKGGFNLVLGRLKAGAALVEHPDVRLLSFTGSVGAGIRIAQAAAPTLKRVVQELGGNAANIVLPDVDLEHAVREGLIRSTRNSGQSCNAPSRMLVPASQLEKAAAIAAETAKSLRIGNPLEDNVDVGPVASRQQFEMLGRIIREAVAEGARLVCGGGERAAGFDQGYYIAPTVLIAERGMKIAREEVFGPVLILQAYADIDDAIELAEATPYGLQSFVQTRDPAMATYVAKRMRTGHVTFNYTPMDFAVPFGGMKLSGNGREGGVEGLEEYLEVKSLVGFDTVPEMAWN
ncbi:aldehyde dehydrogenase family protein [Arvimicrobium flavum]|uniref:aldehyde dehydrogenase family protein n=1 Tax=Arvimicrobium flavum TaxID=3393320 RepID=UPI00237ABB8F|nr:aldehyde dehydrogenase family protein [Mesorhizobium shangrilense]